MGSTHRWFFALAGAACFVAPAAAALSAPPGKSTIAYAGGADQLGRVDDTPPQSDDIVVTGTKITPREIEQAARAVTPPGNLYYEPLAQFQAPVCPGVIGMPDEFAAEMIARVRLVAQRARIRLDKDRCKANLLVIFVANGQAALQNMNGKGRWLFDGISPAQLRDLAEDPALKDLAADPGPVHAWVSTRMQTRYGEAVPKLVMDDPTMSASRLSKPLRKDIVASVVVIDIAAAHGMAVEQLADYAAMRGLARTRPPPQTSPVSTILSLFDKGVIAPLSMTRFDRAYLRSLYGSVANIAGITKIAQVAREVKKAANDE
jgi:hypothetical protein